MGTIDQGKADLDVDADAEKRVVIFHSGHPEFGFLSNFYPCVIDAGCKDRDDVMSFHTTEAYFQAQKYVGRPNATRLIRENFAGEGVAPRQAKVRGGKRGIEMTDEEVRDWEGDGVWNGRRVAVMRDALLKKFDDKMNPALWAKLQATGDATLVERLPRFPDSFWGTKKNGQGRNVLGQLLMQVRDR
jgi:ribA/ribD-fused uncharacterized protein